MTDDRVLLVPGGRYVVLDRTYEHMRFEGVLEGVDVVDGCAEAVFTGTLRAWVSGEVKIAAASPAAEVPEGGQEGGVDAPT